MHNGLSSALLLAFSRHIINGSEDTREIQAQLVRSLSAEDENVGQFSEAHKKALKALRALQRADVDGSGEGPGVVDSGVGVPSEQRPQQGEDGFEENGFDSQNP